MCRDETESKLRIPEGVMVHHLALVESEDIGAGTRIWAFAHVMRGAHLGALCNVGEHCFIEGGAWVGDRVTIKNGTMLWEGVVIEDGAFLGPQVVLSNDRFPRSPRLEQASSRYTDTSWLLPTRVRQGASLGGGAVILPGLTIGQFALVAAGSVVTSDVLDYALVQGNAARQSGWVCECGLRLPVSEERGVCAACGREYETYQGGLFRIQPHTLSRR
jgi:UDP-2-acetamido-3-amino-2,3-dideoxy-glucuronate N-acetyltransferase